MASKKYRIPSEIATWTVNGVNKIFTTTKEITRIEVLTVGWVEYAQYTFSGNTIVLDDAPSSWVVEVTYEYETDKDYLDNTWWIVGETLSWESDGTNKVFTSFFPISLVDEVRVNGVAVVGYSFNGNSVLLASAPTTWQVVTIDYFRKDYGVIDYDRTNYPSLKDIRDIIYMEISQDDVSVQYQEELVNQAIRSWVNEVVSVKTDKSRDISFSIDAAWTITFAPVANSISTLTIQSNVTLPPVGRILTKDWEFIDYTLISNWVVTINKFSKLPTEAWEGYVGYRLPRNYKRVKSVWGGYPIQIASSITWYLNWLGGYIINNWFIYFPYDWIHQVEVELSHITTTDDDSLIYIDEEDVDVVVYYALRQLYVSRENDKLLTTSQLFVDKLNSYKRKMGKKRTQDSNWLMKTKPIWIVYTSPRTIK
jgi:hypothetical protein